jgi:hypothetical protein
MKLGFFFLAAILATGLAAAQDGKSKTRVIVEDGKEMTVTGCVRQNADGGYTLSNVSGKDGSDSSYILAQLNKDEDALEDLEKHVSHRVEITGKAANRGDGKIKVDTTSEIRKADGGTAKTETKSEIKGDLDGLPFLGIRSFRVVSRACP